MNLEPWTSFKSVIAKLLLDVDNHENKFVKYRALENNQLYDNNKLSLTLFGQLKMAEIEINA